MDAKITVTIDQVIIEKAKKYARSKKRSLSELIEGYLKSLIIEVEHESFTPIVKSLKGSFTPPESYNYKELLSNSLSEKHAKQGK
jgi:hypothetical protein